MNTKFFTFRQNNSGGRFHHRPEDGIGFAVIVEAQNANHAKDRAERIGLYFDGCAKGFDCSCCGDRWSGYLDDSDGTDKPEIYGEEYAPCEPGIPSYVHFIGGAFKPIKGAAK